MRTSAASDTNDQAVHQGEVVVSSLWSRIRSSKSIEEILLKVLSIVVVVVVWWLLSMTLPSHILPGPVKTTQTLMGEVISGRVVLHVSATLGRLVSGFFLAMVIGVVTGTIMGLSRKSESIMDAWVMAALTVPGLVYIILAFMWFGLNEFSTSVGIAVTTFPAIAINMWQGVKSIDNKLIDMARVFRTSKIKRFTKVIIPQVLPFVMASTRFGLGIAWKITVLAELLGRSTGVGYMLNYWFQLYNMAQVFAWTVLFTVLMLLIEVVILKRIEESLFKWRPAARI
ncbi:MAG: ABC transporter permease [Chloroflexi bacterium]|nr:ABC transporter permease [Chloroflexota bacterium]